MNKILLYLFIIIELFFNTLSASQINFNQNSKNILLQSEIYIDKENLDFNQIQKKAEFTQSNLVHINLGFVKGTKLWIKLDFYNDEEFSVSKVLEIRNPLLESVILYDNLKKVSKGVLYDNRFKHTINTIFEVTLEPKEHKSCYLEVSNSTTALRLAIYLQDQECFFKDEMKQQALVFLFFGILLMLYVYMTILFVYTREKSYIYYSFYLFALIAQQATYLGVSQIFLPSWLLYYDNLGVVFKVNMLYITAAVFAKSFLQTKEYPKIDKLYNFIIIVALIEIPLFGFPSFYYPEVAILTGFIFVMFNMLIGVFVYRRGYKQARFFVIGWSFLFVGFTLMILDALGIISFMQKVPNLIMYLTALEAILLSLAFTDRYIILKEQTTKASELLVETLKNRQSVIESEILKRTEELSLAYESKKVLLKEVHHRTKNNLQLILSLVRMQSRDSNAIVKESAKNLEYRINAIAKTHQMLYLKDDLQKIDMDEYIAELCSDLENFSEKNLTIDTEVTEIYMPLREAGYVGLILNELVTNAIKYVVKEDIEIEVKMFMQEGVYTLVVSDNGDGYKYSDLQGEGIGTKLVKTLVEDQLEGELEISSEKGLKYTIRFHL